MWNPWVPTLRVNVQLDVQARPPLFPENCDFSSHYRTREAQISNQVLNLRSTGGFFENVPGFSCSSSRFSRSPRSFQARSWRRARGRRARGRQADRTSDICPCQQTDGGRKAETWRETHFSFTPFHFPLADSKKLMTEQEERLWVAACVFCCPVRPGEGQEGGGAGFSFFLASASVTLAPIKNLRCAGSSISTLNCSVGLDFLFTAAVKGHAEERE